MSEILSSKFVLIAALVLFVLAGRKFLLTWKQEPSNRWLWRSLYAALCIVGFVVVAFFQVQL